MELLEWTREGLRKADSINVRLRDASRRVTDFALHPMAKDGTGFHRGASKTERPGSLSRHYVSINYYLDS